MTRVRLYTRDGCHLCHQAEEALAALRADWPHELETVDIDSDPRLRRRYGWVVPVVVIDQRFVLVTHHDEAVVRDALARAAAG